MRHADLVKLALSALGQQKIRTVLTTLGVVFGTFVLASSLSVGQGVQETITRKARRHDRLRRIEVWPAWGMHDQDIPPEVLRMDGKIERLSAAADPRRPAQRWANDHGGHTTVAIDAERMRQLAAIEHVERVVPLVSMQGWLLFNGRSVKGSVTAAVPTDAFFRGRVIAGEFFRAAGRGDGAGERVHALPLRSCERGGCRQCRRQDVAAGIPPERPAGGLTVSILNPDRRHFGREEEQVLAKVVQQLPGKLDRFDLKPEEIDRLRKAAAASRDEPTDPVITVEYVIKGVVGLSNALDRQRQSWSRATPTPM